MVRYLENFIMIAKNKAFSAFVAISLAISALVSVGPIEAQPTTDSLPYGPNTCKAGYVWREAFNGDFVCVTPERRTATHQNNALAGIRRQPGGGPYGPDTCRQGFVWRGARPSDHVCVSPAERSLVATENQQAVARFELYS